MRVLMLAWEFPPRSVGGVGRPRRRAQPRARRRRPRRRAAHAGPPGGAGGHARPRGARAAGPHRPAVAPRRRPRRPRRVGQPPPRAAGDAARAAGGPTSSTPTTGRSPGPPTRSPRCTTRRWSPRSTPPSRGRHGGRVPPGEPSTIHAVESWLAHRRRRGARQLAVHGARGRSAASSCPPERAHLIPNGIDPTWWSTGEAPGSREPLVFTWGRVQYEKGFQVLARAMRLLRSRVPRHRVRHRRARQLPPGAAVADRPGGRERHRATCPASCPTTSSATPSTAPAAWSSRRCTSRSASSPSRPWPAARRSSSPAPADWPSWSTDTGAGLLFEPGNAAELAACIELVLSDQALADEMRKHGAELLADRYSWQAIAGATASVYAGHPSAP